MPTDSVPSVETARLIAARDEAMRRYTQHLAEARLKNNRWRAMLSRNQLAARLSRLSVPATDLNSTIHAH